MLPQVSRATKLGFGPFEFDPATGELRKHGHKVRLSSQPGQVLSALVERPGDLLAREALCRRLWPGAIAGDFEHGLNAAVNKLRQALGDTATQPRYVETLPGLGYRFVAPVYPGAQFWNSCRRPRSRNRSRWHHIANPPCGLARWPRCSYWAAPPRG